APGLRDDQGLRRAGLDAANHLLRARPPGRRLRPRLAVERQGLGAGDRLACRLPGSGLAGDQAGLRGVQGEPVTMLTLSNVEVVYDKVFLAIKGVSLEVEEGGMAALLGANGAGKSTTLK